MLGSAYAQYNAAVWPAQAVALALALVAVWLSRRPGSARALGLLLAAAWLWCGWVFFRGFFAAYDFMAPVYAWAFVAEAALLAWALVWRPLPLQPAASPRGWVALGLMAVALFGLPALSLGGDFGWAGARVVGVAPGPTVLFTLALLLLAEGGRRWLLLAVPLAWCALAGVMAWALGVAEAWPLPLAGALVLLLSLRPSRRAP